MKIYENIPKHLMRNLGIGKGRMWRRRNVKYVVEHRREVVKQTFMRHMEENIDMVIGKIGSEKVRCLAEDDVRKETEVG